MEKRQDRDLVDRVISRKDFVRTLSYREFATSLSLALLIIALHTLLDYYWDDWLSNYEQVIKWSLFGILALMNHVFYKVEHKRSNNFIGRNFHDYIFFLTYIALYWLKSFLYGSNLSFGVDGVGSAIGILLALIIVVIVFELAISILKRVLTKLFRWQIL